MNFQHIMHVDTFALVASLPERIQLFDAITLRQELQPQHLKTRTIYLRGPFGASALNWFDDVEHTNYPVFSNWSECYMMTALIGQAIKRPMAKAMLVELAPDSFVQWHRDEGEYADKHDRYHLPLVTNPGCIMYSGSYAMHIPVGMLTYFNNHVPHSAVNFGDTPRYHLIVDFRKADAGNYRAS